MKKILGVIPARYASSRFLKEKNRKRIMVN